MSRQVVVGFDGSPTSVQALSWAVEEARLRTWGLTALAVLDRRLTDRIEPPDVLTRGPDGDGTERLSEVVAKTTADYPARFSTARGAAAAELVAACDEGDLLVVGTRGRGPLAGLLLGSVSRACLHHAPCSVVTCPAGARPVGHRRVLVEVDASDASRAAIEIAAHEASLRGAALHAVHAVHWDHLGAELVVPDTAQLVSWGKRLLERELACAGVSARPVVIPGHPGDVLVRHSWHADLLVVGATGQNPLIGFRLESTSDYCAQHARCPVMVVRAALHGRRPAGDEAT
jgi:nucleotide-binding universal stress UspA family protein